MFSHQMAESSAELVILEGVSVQMLQLVIDFMYTGVLQGGTEFCGSRGQNSRFCLLPELRFHRAVMFGDVFSVNKEEVPDLAMLLDMMQLSEMKDKCVQLMTDEIHIYNCIGNPLVRSFACLYVFISVLWLDPSSSLWRNRMSEDV